MSKEIHVYLTGRLGNQLFQYAFAKSLQKKYGGKIILNIYELEHRSEKMKHVPGKFHYEMGKYALNDNVELEDMKPKWFAFLGNYINKIARKFIPRLFFKFLAEKGYLIWMRNEYIEIPDMKTDKIFICGWWQDFRFFENVEEELSRDLVPTTLPNESNKELYNLINKSNSVCLTIRGGNYLDKKIRKDLYVCNPKFFYDSIEKMSSIVKDSVFFVFTDDLKWVKSFELEKKFPKFKFFYETGNDSVEEKLRLMTNCKNFIISNSTFSWWAQFLCTNKNKVVIAPDRWHTNGNKCGLYMKNWVLVETYKEDFGNETFN